MTSSHFQIGISILAVYKPLSLSDLLPRSDNRSRVLPAELRPCRILSISTTRAISQNVSFNPPYKRKRSEFK
jgi:hypothetical protein